MKSYRWPKEREAIRLVFDDRQTNQSLPFHADLEEFPFQSLRARVGGGKTVMRSPSFLAVPKLELSKGR